MTKPVTPIARAIEALTENHSGALLERSIGNELRRMEQAITPTRNLGRTRLTFIADAIDEALLALAEIDE